jgi:hypothetical protein
MLRDADLDVYISLSDDISCSEADPVQAKMENDVATERGARRVPISCHHAGWFNQVFLRGEQSAIISLLGSILPGRS